MQAQSQGRIAMASRPEFFVRLTCGHCHKRNRLSLATYKESQTFRCTGCKRTNLLPERRS